MSLSESIIEDAARTWIWALGYTVGHMQQLAPGEAAAERYGMFNPLMHLSN